MAKNIIISLTKPVRSLDLQTIVGCFISLAHIAYLRYFCYSWK